LDIPDSWGFFRKLRNLCLFLFLLSLSWQVTWGLHNGSLQDGGDKAYRSVDWHHYRIFGENFKEVAFDGIFPLPDGTRVPHRRDGTVLFANRNAFHWAPGLPLGLSLLGLIGIPAKVWCWALVLCFALTAPLTAWALSAVTSSPKILLGAGLGVALFPNFIINSYQMTELLSLVGLALMAGLILRYRGRRREIILLGILAAILTLVRYNHVVLLAFFPIWLWSSGRRLEGIKIGLVMLLCLSPWIARNMTHLGRPLLNTQSSWLLFTCNFPSLWHRSPDPGIRSIGTYSRGSFAELEIVFKKRIKHPVPGEELQSDTPPHTVTALAQFLENPQMPRGLDTAPLLKMPLNQVNDIFSAEMKREFQRHGTETLVNVLYKVRRLFHWHTSPIPSGPKGADGSRPSLPMIFVWSAWLLQGLFALSLWRGLAPRTRPFLVMMALFGAVLLAFYGSDRFRTPLDLLMIFLVAASLGRSGEVREAI